MYEEAPEQAIAIKANFTRDLLGESSRVHAAVVEEAAHQSFGVRAPQESFWLNHDNDERMPG